MSALNSNKSVLDGNGQVKIPARLLKMLLQIALSAAEFDEDSYLRENADVAKAIARGEVESARLHYIGFGYFEGRRGGGPSVDNDWYLSQYPDVAAAVREGKIKSAETHFHAIGGGEGRCPAPEYEGDAAQWKSAIKGT
ncbi:hypothetical protein [Bradyrhizobium sp. Gha]|uniref:hypothetical protein n=1 Tax=Bradyrhizobium sp. Gha TaxID=1855318 RepID=UPI001FCD708E|nr:hypothetical protein [Bradyrhizobium sp. Gha]